MQKLGPSCPALPPHNSPSRWSNKMPRSCRKSPLLFSVSLIFLISLPLFLQFSPTSYLFNSSISWTLLSTCVCVVRDRRGIFQARCLNKSTPTFQFASVPFLIEIITMSCLCLSSASFPLLPPCPFISFTSSSSGRIIFIFLFIERKRKKSSIRE